MTGLGVYVRVCVHGGAFHSQNPPASISFYLIEDEVAVKFVCECVL